MWRTNKQWTTHRDVRADFDSLGIPHNWLHEADPDLRDEYFKRYGQHRERMFRKHLATLSQAERGLLEAGRHPSQSHAMAEEARRYADELLVELRGHGVDFVEDIRLGYYHCDRIVLTIVISESTSVEEAADCLPFYYRGFETRCSYHKMSEDAASDGDKPANQIRTSIPPPDGLTR